jgi:hypothetical protein
MEVEALAAERALNFSVVPLEGGEKAVGASMTMQPVARRAVDLSWAASAGRVSRVPMRTARLPRSSREGVGYEGVASKRAPMRNDSRPADVRNLARDIGNGGPIVLP